MRKIILFGLCVCFMGAMLTGCAQPVKKIAVIRNLVQDDHTVQFLEGAIEQGKKSGYTVDTFVSGGDDAKMQALINAAIDANYAGMILSHGTQSYSYELLKKADEKGIKLVTFDTIINGTINGLTQTMQNDKQLAELSLGELVSSFEKPAKIVKIWYSGGMLPFDNRETVYQQMQADGVIQTVGEIDLPHLTNVQGDVEAALTEILGQEGLEIDGVWAAWDEMAKGALTAIRKSNRDNLKLVSIDISQTDRQLMEQNPTIWQATAAVDAKMLGAECMNLLVKKFSSDASIPLVFFDGELYTIQDGKVLAKK